RYTTSHTARMYVFPRNVGVPILYAMTALLSFLISDRLSRGFRPPPDLHSFPTRRSSDLSRLLAARCLRLWNRGDCWCSGRIAAGDRKSTRLNSSHQIMSYAVFCWKRKTVPT